MEKQIRPKLSVVICTFNRANNLKQCLESLQKQNFKDFEAVIVDGGSTDNTQQIILQFAQTIAIKQVSDSGQGLAKARDLGWRASQGKFVSWVDDDVVVSENWAKSIVKTLESDEKIGGVSGPTIVKAELLKNRDVFFFYNKKGLTGLLGKFWNRFFLEGQMYEPGKLFKSGAWSPGANFTQSLQIRRLKDVDYLEACNMTMRRDLIEKVNGFDFNYTGVAEWSELDLAIRIKKLGYRLVFSPKVKVNHNISRGGVYPKRAEAKQRMENFFRFYFKHVFKPKPDYLFKFLSYLLFLNFYWIYKTTSTKNPDWLSGCLGTITGLSLINFKSKTKNLEPLEQRYQANKTAEFQAAQTELFLGILDKKYNQVLELGCGKGYFTYVGAKHGKFANCYGADIFPDFQKEEIEEYAESATYRNIKENIVPFEDNSFDLVFSIDVIEHVEDTVTFIKENLRICKKGGEIILGTPNLLRVGNLILWILGKLKFPRKIGRDAYGDAIHFKEYKADDLVKEIVYSSNNEISPQDIKVYRCWLGILPLNLGVRKFPKSLDNFCQFFFVKLKKPL